MICIKEKHLIGKLRIHGEVHGDYQDMYILGDQIVQIHQVFAVFAWWLAILSLPIEKWPNIYSQHYIIEFSIDLIIIIDDIYS